MATKDKAAAKASKKAAAPAAGEVDDLLGGKKAPAAKKAAKGGEEDDLLGGKKAPAAKKEKAAAPAAPAKKAAKKAARAEGVSTDDVKAALLKCRKLTSYADVAESTGADIRQVRRTARAMRDAGEVELVKEGTVVFVKKA